MIVDLIAILTQYGTTTVQKIRENLASTGTDATGKTSRSLRFEVKNETDKQILRIIGKPYFMVVETGRKPTPNYKPSVQFVASIQQWMTAKGVNSNAYAIAQSIHKKGTKLFRDGGRKDIVSNVVNQSLTDQISKDVLDKFASSYLQQVKILASGTNIN